MDVREDPQVGWTDAQWRRIRQVVSEEAQRARVAGSCLPVYGPLPPSTQVVPSEVMKDEDGTVDDVATARIVEISRDVTLTRQQIEEEELAGAVLLFRRAANIVARAEDWVIFNGLCHLDTALNPVSPSMVPSPEIRGREVKAGYETQEEYEQRLRQTNPGTLGLLEVPVPGSEQVVTLNDLGSPEELVTAIVRAIAVLEKHGYLGPFVCVLGTEAFVAAHRPVRDSMVLPRDRIEPILGRQMLRSSTIDDHTWERISHLQAERISHLGVVFSLAGDPIDLALAVDISPRFLRVNEDARYVFRVSERFALRVKDPQAITRLQLNPQHQQPANAANPAPRARGRGDSSKAAGAD